MSSGHSYDTYNDWINGPLLLGAGSTFFGILAIFVTIAIATIACKDHFVEYVVNPLFLFARVTFGDHIKEREYSDTFTFYHYEVSPWHVCMISTITSVVLGPTFMSFWVSFIAEETFGCNPQLDCFLRDQSTFDVPSSEPLDNCTSYDINGTNGTVVCFEFIFDLTRGFSSAVGFMGVAVVYCRLYIYILILLREFCSNKCQMDCTKYVSYIMQIVTFIIFLLIAIIVSSVPFFRDVVFKTNKSRIIYFAYMLSFVYNGPFAGIFVAYILREHPTDQDQAPNRQNPVNHIIENLPHNS